MDSILVLLDQFKFIDYVLLLILFFTGLATTVFGEFFSSKYSSYSHHNLLRRIFRPAGIVSFLWYPFFYFTQVIWYCLIRFLILPKFSIIGTILIIIFISIRIYNLVYQFYSPRILQKYFDKNKRVSPLVEVIMRMPVTISNFTYLSIMVLSLSSFLQFTDITEQREDATRELTSFKRKYISVLNSTHILQQNLERIETDIMNSQTDIDSLNMTLEDLNITFSNLTRHKVSLEGRIAELENKTEDEIKQNVILQMLRELLNKNSTIGIIIGFFVGFISSLMATWVNNIARSRKRIE